MALVRWGFAFTAVVSALVALLLWQCPSQIDRVGEWVVEQHIKGVADRATAATQALKQGGPAEISSAMTLLEELGPVRFGDRQYVFKDALIRSLLTKLEAVGRLEDVVSVGELWLRDFGRNADAERIVGKALLKIPGRAAEGLQRLTESYRRAPPRPLDEVNDFIARLSPSARAEALPWLFADQIFFFEMSVASTWRVTWDAEGGFPEGEEDFDSGVRRSGVQQVPLDVDYDRLVIALPLPEGKTGVRLSARPNVPMILLRPRVIAIASEVAAGTVPSEKDSVVLRDMWVNSGRSTDVLEWTQTQEPGVPLQLLTTVLPLPSGGLEMARTEAAAWEAAVRLAYGDAYYERYADAWRETEP